VTNAADVVIAAFQELVTLSAVSPNEKLLCQPWMGTVPLLVTVSWT